MVYNRRQPKTTPAAGDVCSVWFVFVLVVVVVLSVVALVYSLKGQNQSTPMAMGMLPLTKKRSDQCLRLVQCVDTNRDGLCQEGETVVSERELCAPASELEPQVLLNISLAQQKLNSLDATFVATVATVHQLGSDLLAIEGVHRQDVVRLDGVDESASNVVTSLSSRVSLLEQLDISKQARLQYLHNNITQHHARLIALENGLVSGAAPYLNETWTADLDVLDARSYALEQDNLEQENTLTNLNASIYYLGQQQKEAQSRINLLEDNVTILAAHLDEDFVVHNLLRQEDVTLHYLIALNNGNLSVLTNQVESHLVEFGILQQGHNAILSKQTTQEQQLQQIFGVMGEKQLMTQQLQGNLTLVQQQTNLLLDHLNALQQVEQAYQVWKAGTTHNITVLQAAVAGLTSAGESVLTTAELTANYNQLNTLVTELGASLVEVEGTVNAASNNLVTQNLTLQVLELTVDNLIESQALSQGILDQHTQLLTARSILIDQFKTQFNETVDNVQTTLTMLSTRIDDLQQRESVIESDVALLQTNTATLQVQQEAREAQYQTMSAQISSLKSNQTDHDNRIDLLEDQTLLLDQRTLPWTLLAPQMEASVGALQDWRLVVDAHLADIAPLEQSLTTIDTELTSEIRAVNASCLLKTEMLQHQVDQLTVQLAQANQEIVRLEGLIDGSTTQPPAPTTPTLQVCYAAHVHENGDVLFTHGLSVSRTAVGRYTVVMNEAQTMTKYPVFIQVEEKSSSSLVDDIQANVIDGTRQTTGFSLHIVRQDQGNKNNPSYEDRAFSVQVLCIR